MTGEFPVYSAERAARRPGQIRAFVLIWTGITVVMGVSAFVAIFVASGFLLQPEPANAMSAAAIASPTPVQGENSPVPTVEVIAPATATVAQVAAPTSTPQAIAQQPVATATTQPTLTPTLLPVADTAFDFGIQVQHSPDIYDYWVTVVRDQLHLQWIKTQVRWEVMEPVEDQYDWSTLDIAIPVAYERGAKIMLSIVTAPDWAREPGADLEKHGPPADPQDYVEFVTAILDRYPGMVSAIEVWNEMNLDREWASPAGLQAADYVALLQATFNAVHAIDPGIIIISGALSPTGFDDGVSAIDDFRYLDMLIAAGMLNYTDCVGAHHNGYNIGPLVPWDEAPNDPESATAFFRGPFDNPHHSWSLYSTLTTYRNKVQLAGGDQRLCVTEFGWAVSEDMEGEPIFPFAVDNTLEEQAEYFVEAIEWMSETDVVWLAWVWNLNYGAQAGFDPGNDNALYSILRPGSIPAPAWDAIAQYRQEHFSNRS